MGIITVFITAYMVFTVATTDLLDNTHVGCSATDVSQFIRLGIDDKKITEICGE